MGNGVQPEPAEFCKREAGLTRGFHFSSGKWNRNLQSTPRELERDPQANLRGKRDAHGGAGAEEISKPAAGNANLIETVNRLR